MRRLVRVMLVAACAGLFAACAGADPGSEVTSQVVSDPTTQDIVVFAPEGEGPWPVVFALHGIDGAGRDMDELATRLAAAGLVVFAPTFRSDLTTNDGLLQTVLDVECGYRFVRSIAVDHGGDLGQPVTFVGWSMGATLALQAGLTEEIDPSGEIVSCFSEVPRADVIVAVSGCHESFDFPEGALLDFYDPPDWGNESAGVVLVAGDADTRCPARHSRTAAADLRANGHEVELVILEGADHFAPISKEFVRDGVMVEAEDHSAGERTVDAILAAIAAARPSGSGR
jgi:dienelactone hydrolase